MLLDVVPDIHGRLSKLDAALAALGYRQRGGRWHAPQEGRRLVFLGDLVDRGPDQREVIARVRALEEDGLADRVMGNHEMNALHWAMERDGAPLRPHSEKNRLHHAAFLDAYAHRDAERATALDFLARARLCHAVGAFVFVHAFWTPTLEADAGSAFDPRDPLPGFDALANTPGFLDAAAPIGRMGQAIDLMTKGPESRLPDGYGIETEHGVRRSAVRRAWWALTPQNWAEASVSVPDGSLLPDGIPEAVLGADTIPDHASVVFGHYWRRDVQTLGRIPAFGGRFACLDQSAGAGGEEPLAVLTLDASQPRLPLDAKGFLHPDALTVVR